MKASVLLSQTETDINKLILVFIDNSNIKYFLDQELVPAKGFDRQIIDLLYSETKPFEVQYKELNGRNYITKLHY